MLFLVDINTDISDVTPCKSHELSVTDFAFLLVHIFALLLIKILLFLAHTSFFIKMLFFGMCVSSSLATTRWLEAKHSKGCVARLLRRNLLAECGVGLVQMD